MGWNIQVVDQSYLPRVRAFFQEVFRGGFAYGTADLFQWKIFANPHGPGMLNVIEVDGKLVSTTSLTCKRLIFNGETLKTAEIGDTFTSSDFQRRGMFADLVNHTRAAGLNANIEFIYGTPNENSLPGYQKKANFKVLSNLDVRSLTLPLGLPPKLFVRLPWVLRDLADYFLRLVVYLHLALRLQKSGSGKYSVTKNVDLSEDVWRDFWQSARLNANAYFDRSFESMSWRYWKSPNTYDCYYLWENGLLKGYLIGRNMPNLHYSTFVIADCFFASMDKAGVFVIMWHLVRDALRNRISLISGWFVAGSEIFELFKSLGFWDRGKVPVIAFCNENFKKVDNASTRWHFSIGDSDNV